MFWARATAEDVGRTASRLARSSMPSATKIGTPACCVRVHPAPKEFGWLIVQTRSAKKLIIVGFNRINNQYFTTTHSTNLRTKVMSLAHNAAGNTRLGLLAIEHEDRENVGNRGNSRMIACITRLNNFIHIKDVRSVIQKRHFGWRLLIIRIMFNATRKCTGRIRRALGPAACGSIGLP